MLPPFLQHLPSTSSIYQNAQFRPKASLGSSHVVWWPPRQAETPAVVVLFIPGQSRHSHVVRHSYSFSIPRQSWTCGFLYPLSFCNLRKAIIHECRDPRSCSFGPCSSNTRTFKTPTFGWPHYSNRKLYRNLGFHSL